MEPEMFFNRLKEQQEKDLPFVVYRSSLKNNRILRAFFQPSAEVYKTTTFSETGFVLAPFDLEKDVILFPKEMCEVLETVINDKEELPISTVSQVLNTGSNSDKENHIYLVQKGIDAITQGKLKKVVLSRKEVLQTDRPDMVLLFQRLLKKYPDAFVYLMHHPGVGTWLGATPEILLEVERNRLRTMALAGTKKYIEEKEVEWGQKEKEEQQIVTDIILENLQETCTNISLNGPYTTRAGNLLHLRTDITGKIISEKEDSVTDAMNRVSTNIDAMNRVSTPDSLFKGNPHSPGNLKKLIYSIHPTPAICGFPIEEARQFILENENYDREFYTGFLGEINMKQEVKRNNNRRNQENQAYSSLVSKTSLFVNLRCMKITDDTPEIFVGGGITRESVSEDEWEETQNKAGTMKAVLDMDKKIK